MLLQSKDMPLYVDYTWQKTQRRGNCHFIRLLFDKNARYHMSEPLKARKSTTDHMQNHILTINHLQKCCNTRTNYGHVDYVDSQTGKHNSGHGLSSGASTRLISGDFYVQISFFSCSKFYTSQFPGCKHSNQQG